MWSWRKLALAAVGLFAVVAAPSVGGAQTGTINGTVIDSVTKRPIEGASVLVVGTTYGTQTKANGGYTILSVPAGTYTVQARMLGYTAFEFENALVRIDVTRTLNFALGPSTQTLTAVRVQAPEVPLVEQGVVGSATSLTAEMISALPVTSISEVLALQQGYQELPQNNTLQSVGEERRSTTASSSIRGGRGGSSVSLVDGVPVNNPVFGSAAIQANTMGISQLEFSPGYMEPQYGNGLGGITNTSVREGGERFQGGIDYQTSAVPGLLGARAEELLNQHLFRGFISGAVPGTSNKLRYSFSGQVQSQKANVLKFDESVSSWNTNSDTNRFGQSAAALDLTKGWQAFGGTQNQQVLGKLTFLPTQTLKATFTMVNQARETTGYDRRYTFSYAGGETGFDPWKLVDNRMDSLGLNSQNGRNSQYMIQGSARDASSLYALRLEKRMPRANLSVAFGQTGLNRLTCNVWMGVCAEDKYWRANFSENFWQAFAPVDVPYWGSDLYYGGEDYTTRSVRADYLIQATDHHKLQVGASFLRHDIVYDEIVGGGGQSGNSPKLPQLYRAKPREVSSYLQDNIDYDFLSIRVGVRYDYGLARGAGFANPLNATNGTTAREVCEGTAGYEKFTYGALSGSLACLGSPLNAANKPVLLDSATRLAQLDDFKEAKARTAFSPRIGLSFPLTERSALFFNAGRYTRNPSYHDVYRNSGVGTVAGLGPGTDNFCSTSAIKPGTTKVDAVTGEVLFPGECHPPLIPNNPEFIGNPNLLLEQSTMYEVGYTGQIGNNYAIDVTIYNRDETGLTGTRTNDAIQDIGSTYNGQALPLYSIAVNQDFLTSRGMDVGFRRRTVDRWGYNINYGWARTTENSPPPDRAYEADVNGELNQGNTLRESLSGRDQAHTFNGSIFLVFRTNDVPKFFGSSVLKNTSFTLTYSHSAGRPYTPGQTSTASGVRNSGETSRALNSGRAPATQSANVSFNKNMVFGSARYGFTARITNIFNIRNCTQVFANTGDCNSGIRLANNRSDGTGSTSSGGTSTNVDNAQYRSTGRRFFTGLTITF